jgi:AcrR family transcriptional regulator
VVAAAIAITRVDGLRGVTMRALADRLGATPMALYRHVGDRDELALLVVDQLFAGLVFPDQTLAAVPWLRVLAHAIRAIGREHPGVMDLLLEEGPAVKSTLVILDRVVSKLHDAGLPWKEAAAIHNTFLSWLAATVRREEQWAARRDEAPLRRFLDAAGRMPPAEYPGLAHVLPYMPGADVDTEFEQSLAFMLDGIHARIEAQEQRRKPRKR